MKKTLLLLATLALGSHAHAQTYNQNAGSWGGSELINWKDFTFNSTLATNGPVDLTIRWLACAHNGTSKLWIEFQTGTDTYEQVYYEGNNSVSCLFVDRATTVSNTIFTNARNFAGSNKVKGRFKILDACSPGMGCASTDPQLMILRMHYTVRPANFTGTSLTPCPGGTVQFADASLGTPTTYAWTFPGGVPATSTAQNPVVQYPTTGDYDVKLTIQTDNGPDSLVRTNYVKVRALPNANAGVDRSFCAGSSVQLQASGGNTYQWFPAEGLSNPNIANPMASPTTSTTYTVMVTSFQNCQASDAIQLTMVPLPTVAVAGAAATICAGDTADLTATGADLYTWSPNLFISSTSGAEAQAWPTSTFTWNVHGTDLVGCSHDTTVTVTVSPMPAVPVITQNINGLTTADATSYQWFLEGSPIAAGTEQTWVPTENGNYSVTVTNAGGCSATSASYFFGSTGIANSATGGISIHPQPAQDQLVVQGLTAGQDLQLMDATGRVVLQATAQAPQTVLSVASLPAGSYVLRISGQGQEFSQRVVVAPQR